MIRNLFVALTLLTAAQARDGVVPADSSGRALNLGFEDGKLTDWKAEGKAFEGQPVKGDAVRARRADMASKHDGEFWIGGFERFGDGLKGRLTSSPFKVTHPFGTFLVGGGQEAEHTRVEILRAESGELIAYAAGREQEDMELVYVDLREDLGRMIQVRLVDDSDQPWGHVNFDDFSFHERPPRGARILNEPGTKPQIRQAAPDVVMNAGLEPKAAAKAMTVPEGFSVDLIASEPDIVQPIAYCWDARGRMWVVEGMTYPRRANDNPPKGDSSQPTQEQLKDIFGGKDRVLIFEDADHNGSFETRKVFAENLNLVSGIEIGFGGVYIGAAPYLLHIPDKDHDDKPDGNPVILADGFGWHDTHETLNSFIWGPDGWLYGCHGVFTQSNVRVLAGDKPIAEKTRINAGYWRYHPTRHVFEVYAHGTSNPWGLDYNEYGDWFSEACVIPHFWHIIQGGYYLRQSDPLGHPSNPYVYKNIETIADHVHYLGNRPHSGNGRSDAAGGGHAHAGLCIYNGDNFPPEYRGRAFFFNVHGKRINQEQIVPEGSGYVAKHLPDFLKANDQWFSGVALKVGPDGAIYFIDWYDQQKCHRTEPLIWDRGNGRIYRVKYDKTWKAYDGRDLGKLSEEELVLLHAEPNDWFVRTSALQLQCMQANGPLEFLSQKELSFDGDKLRSRGIAISDFARKITITRNRLGVLGDGHLLEYFDRSSRLDYTWPVSGLMSRDLSSEQKTALILKAAQDSIGPKVRLALASALQRLPIDQRWDILAALTKHPEDASDHNLPQMYWYALEPMVAADPKRGLALAEASPIALLSEMAARRACVDDAHFPLVLAAAAESKDPARQAAYLRELRQALRGRRIAPPEGWEAVYSKLSTGDSNLREQVDALAVAFGDRRIFPSLRASLADATHGAEKRAGALQILAEAKDAELVPILRRLLDDKALRAEALRAAANFEDGDLAKDILAKLATFTGEEKRAALSALATRVSTATLLVGALESKALPTSEVSAFVARQIEGLGNAELSKRLANAWGVVQGQGADISAEMERYKKLLTPSFLAKANVSHGRFVYSQTCQACHTLFGEGTQLGPDLTGSNRANLDYILENVLNPNALIGKDYQLQLVTLKDGRVLSGMIREETARGFSVQMLDQKQFVAADDVSKREALNISMMPTGQLATLNDEAVRDLVAYLAGPAQVPLAGPTAPIDPTTGKVPSALEGEAMKVLAETGSVSPQNMAGYPAAKWSGNEQLWWTGAKPGDKLELALPVAEAGNYKLSAVLTKAPDYGIVQLSLDGQALGQPIDLYATEVTNTGVITLGEKSLTAGDHKLTVEIKGANPEAAKAYMFGLDYVKLE